MGLQDDYNQVILNSKGIEEVKDLVHKLIKQVLMHIGMIRYHNSKIKEFDMSNSELGKLLDKCIRLMDKIRITTEKHELHEYISSLVIEVDNLAGGKVERSVVASLKKSFEVELRKMEKNIDYSDLWEF